jgi:hypothetical protein
MEDEDYPPLPETPLMVNECSENHTNFRIYSHNVNGLMDETKLEYQPRIMEKR